MFGLTQGAIALGRAYLPSLHPHPPQRTGEDSVEGAAGLMLQRAVGPPSGDIFPRRACLAQPSAPCLGSPIL